MHRPSGRTRGPGRDSPQGLLIASGIFDRRVPGSPAMAYVGVIRVSGNAAGHHPPPPPPPPPPPDEPPPPEPLLDPGAVEAEATLLESEDPTVPTKAPGLDQTLPEPAYHPNVFPRRAGSAST